MGRPAGGGVGRLGHRRGHEFLLIRAKSPQHVILLGDGPAVTVNLAGLPGLSVPCGFTPQGLPAGLQLIGRPLDEATLLRVGDAYQRRTDWHTLAPPGQEGEAA